MHSFTIQTFLGSQHAALVREIGQLRFAVWTEDGFALPEARGGSWLDSHDEHATHVVAFEDDRLVASSRVCLHDTIEALPDHDHFVDLAKHLRFPLATWTRQVVRRSHRQLGISRRLDDARLAFARANQARAILVETSPLRIRGLERRGFIPLRAKHGVRFPDLVSTAMLLDLLHD